MSRMQTFIERLTSLLLAQASNYKARETSVEERRKENFSIESFYIFSSSAEVCVWERIFPQHQKLSGEKGEGSGEIKSERNALFTDRIFRKQLKII